MKCSEPTLDARPRRDPSAGRATTVTAHAGSLDTQDNSEESFARALGFPVDFLEADVRFSPEGGAYLSHDALPPDRMAGAMTLGALLRMAAAHPSVRLNLDLKEYSAIGAMRDLVVGCGMGSRVVLTGLRIESIPEARAAAGGLPYFLNAEAGFLERSTRAGAARLAARVRACGAVGLNTHKAFATRRVARALAEAGLKLSVWTVDEEAEMRAVLALGPDNVTTRRPDRLIALVDGGKEAEA